MPDDFGKKLRHLRRQRGLTQAQLAQQLALTSHAHISHLESQRKLPSLDLILRLVQYMGVTTDYVLCDAIPVEADTEQTATYAEHDATFLQCFSAKLRYLRKQRGMTQEDLARHVASRTQAHISLLELGGSEPSIELVLQLASLFQVTTDYLLNDAIPVERVEKP
jgi:transcriptional regulator with XRE-family HTH domain